MHSKEWSHSASVGGWTFRGSSSAAQNTALAVVELGIGLDCGSTNLPIFGDEIRDLVVTHGHWDHVKALPGLLQTVKEGKRVNIYCPSNIVPTVEAFIQSSLCLIEDKGESKESPKKYNLVGVNPKDTMPFRFDEKGRPIWIMQVFQCYHTVRSCGYGFDEIKYDLKVDLDFDFTCASLSEDEIKMMYSLIKERKYLKDPILDEKPKRDSMSDYKTGIEMPSFCFMGDTDERALYSVVKNTIVPHSYLEKYKIMIIECTFLAPQDIKYAVKDRHMHWSKLEPYVRSHPETQFVLIHFSKRYLPSYIHNFFGEVGLSNITLFIPYHVENLGLNFSVPIVPKVLSFTGTSSNVRCKGYQITELNISLDCGNHNLTSVPTHIFISDTDFSCTNQMPTTLMDCASIIPTIFCPVGWKKHIFNYIDSSFSMTKNTTSPKIHNKYKLVEAIPDTKIAFRLDKKNKKLVNWYVEIIEIEESKKIGYGFIEVRRRLRPEYHHLSPEEISRIKKGEDGKDGKEVDVSYEIQIPTICYLGSAKINILYSHDEKGEIVYNPKLLDYKTIVIECNFLEGVSSRDKEKTDWIDLAPYIINHPETKFILIGIDCGYSNEFVTKFFDDLKFRNVVPFIPSVDDLKKHKKYTKKQPPSFRTRSCCDEDDHSPGGGAAAAAACDSFSGKHKITRRMFGTKSADMRRSFSSETFPAWRTFPERRQPLSRAAAAAAVPRSFSSDYLDEKKKMFCKLKPEHYVMPDIYMEKASPFSKIILSKT